MFKADEPYCSNCGYSFTNLTDSARCPECGRPVVEVLARRSSDVPIGSVRWQSERQWKGRPLVVIAKGPARRESMGVARGGWINLGDIACGPIAVGGVACGGVAIGGVSVGAGFALGGMAVGGVAMGGLGIGVLAIAASALGVFTIGSASICLVWGVGVKVVKIRI